MIVATAGHVDHGKTALVQALTGKDTDTLAEEKQRGLTITPGFAYTDAGAHRIGFVDVPGHQRFIHNMLAGVAGIDAVLLVVAADEGVMPQTREHLRIIDLLGVRHGIVAITKTDRADRDMLQLVREEVHSLVSETGLRRAPIVETSTAQAASFDALKRNLRELIDEIPNRGIDGNFRLAVDRVFTIRGAGLVVTGTVHAGEIGRGDELIVQPAGVTARVRGIFSEDQPAERALAGHRCALNLTGLDTDAVSRGSWLTAKDGAGLTSVVGVRLQIPPDAGRQLTHWMPVHVFHGAGHVTGRVSIPSTSALPPGSQHFGQLVLDTPLHAAHGDMCILRDQSSEETIAGAFVLDIFAHRRGGPTRWKNLSHLEHPDPRESLGALLNASPRGVALEEFRLNRNLTPKEASRLFSAVDLVIVEVQNQSVGFLPERWASLCDDLVTDIIGWQDQHPSETGPRLDEISDWNEVSPNLLPLVIQHLVRQGRIVQKGPNFHTPEFQLCYGDKDKALFQRVQSVILNRGIRPPLIRELAEELHESPKRIKDLLKKAQQIGDVVAVTEDRFFLAETMDTLAARFQALAAEGEMISTAAFRDASGLGRNMAVEVLEYFDRVGVSQRIGNARRFIVRAEQSTVSTLHRDG